MKSKKILMVAGEVSGDLHGSLLIEAIRRFDPKIQFFGVGGERLEKKGMNVLCSSQSLSVVGITEVFFKIGSILKALRRLKRSLRQERPDLVILIDFPDFNLRVAKMAHRKGIPVLYYISPQVWAWRSGRVKTIARLVKKMLVFFPFEVPLYEAAGVDVEWVGHPLLDLVKPSFSKGEAYRRFGLDSRLKTIGLLPGSRVHEVKRLLPPMVDSIHLLRKEMPDLQFIIPVAPGISKEAFSPWMKNISIPVQVVEGWTYDVMNVSDLLITASGTATLEAMILGKPMVIVYKVSWADYWIGRLMIQVDHIGLANLVAEKEIAPELIQTEVTPERIAEEALRLLRDPILNRHVTESMAEGRQKLGESGAVQRAADIVYSMLHEVSGHR
jgi:lipid-A-disaccharide synthase